ncbi:membrane protein [Microvirga vignae]|uniref:Membrane protein n=1 Tax=Microvirga vignae TaxID=1225564 RepID=A0A0H1R4K3_9HYPH|nr:membrane protein [Microvirga vignae]
MSRLLLVAALSGTMLAGATSIAQASDLLGRNKAPAAPVVAIETFRPWMIRGRALVVHPQPNAGLNVGGDVDVSTSVVPELDISYFFTPNLATELIFGVTPHRVKGAGSLDNVQIGDVWLLPPTLMLQYHFTDLGMVKPYVGAGINYTFFFDEKAKGSFEKFNLANTIGFALQAGVDIMIDKHWGINLDVKKIFLEPDVSVNDGAINGKVKIDPWLISAGVTYRF